MCKNGCEYSFNRFRRDIPRWEGPDFEFLERRDMLDFHRSIEGYRPTPLVSLDSLARELGIGKIFVKDESFRFGIKAFKAFGASYAIYRFLGDQWRKRFGEEKGFNEKSFSSPGVLKKLGSYTFCAATDGNHGRAVAWTARKLKQRAVIYMPANTVPARIHNIEAEEAEVVLVEGTFDDCVERCAHDAEKNRWQAVSDTAYPGYMDIPRYIMLGYTSIFREMEDTLHREGEAGVDVVILPAGVGGLAAAGTVYYVKRYGKDRPTLVCLEPVASDCFLESIRFGNGKPLPTRGNQESIMAGLNCGIPSPVAWPIIKEGMDLFMAVTDDYAAAAMIKYHRHGIVSGESGASGLAGLLALLKDKKLADPRRRLRLGKDCRVLLINTEGDTDPVNYREITAGASAS